MFSTLSASAPTALTSMSAAAGPAVTSIVTAITTFLFG